MVALSIACAFALAVWTALLLHPARPWDFRPVGEDEEPPAGACPPPDGPWPAVCVLVPARNEASALPHTLPPLLGQRYHGPLRVVLVDDRSDDGTAAIARRLASERDAEDRLQVLDGQDLPPGWVGKMWALEQGARAAFGGASGDAGSSDAVTADRPPEAAYVMLTDADIVHAEGSVERLVRESEAWRLGLNSRMARLRCETFWERVLIPAFVFFFNALYPMRRANRPEDPLAASAGGCVLLSRAAWDAIGGFSAIKDKIIDDVALSREVKGRGFPIRLSLSRSEVRSYRGYDTLAGIWSMVRRTAFTELRYSWARLAGAEVAMAVLFVAPVLGALAGLAGAVYPAIVGLAALAVMAIVYRPGTRFYGLPLPYAFAMPLIGALYMAMTLDSAVRHAFGVRSSWRGRSYGTDGGAHAHVAEATPRPPTVE